MPKVCPGGEMLKFQFDRHINNRLTTNSHNDQLSEGLIAQLVEHCTGIAEVEVQILIKPEFFRLSFIYCSSKVNK